MNKKECFRSVPMRNIPLHRENIYTILSMGISGS